MEKLKQIMYGVTDFARMRAENGYFVDRTGLIRELEKTSYAMFLRPRRFGKSLLCSILQCYYDKDYADRFDEFFGGLDIGKNPTEERGKYLWLHFNFSQVEKRVEFVQSSFDDVANGMGDFAETGDWHGAIDAVSAVVSSYWKVRDAIEGERVVQTALCSLLFVGHGPYVVRHEQEAAGGFVDVVFEPQFSRWPQMRHAAILEVKYLKKGGTASVSSAADATSRFPPASDAQGIPRPQAVREADALAGVCVPPEKLKEIRDAAAAQIERYAADHDLARLWNLKENGGPVTLHRIVLVFHGGDVALCEEIAESES